MRDWPPLRPPPGTLTPPLPCAACRDLFPMEMVTWTGQWCRCRPGCDKVTAEVEVRCLNCGTVFPVSYADEPSMDLEEWWGGDETCVWNCQVWNRGAPSLYLDQGGTEQNRWLEDIANLLEEGRYCFPTPKEYP